METFHWIVIGIALFFLIVILVLVGIMINSKQSKNNVFPPVQQSCPDLWMNDGSGNCFYVGQNGGSAFDLSANQTMYYKGDRNFPVYINNQSYIDPADSEKTNKLCAKNNATGVYLKTDISACGWSNSSSYINSLPFSTPSTISNNTNYAVFSPSDKAWSSNGAIALCEQKKFANNNNIYWDGVSNTNQC